MDLTIQVCFCWRSLTNAAAVTSCYSTGPATAGASDQAILHFSLLQLHTYILTVKGPEITSYLLA
jgi:hypothetical protein